MADKCYLNMFLNEQAMISILNACFICGSFASIHIRPKCRIEMPLECIRSFNYSELNGSSLTAFKSATNY